MVFSSITFLFYFLAAVLLVYYIVPRKAKNIVLLIASLLFFASGSLTDVFIILLSIAFNFVSGLVIDRVRRKKLALTVNILVNAALSVFAGSAAAPLGIAFYTLRALSYTIDVYRRKISVSRSFINFALYLSLFPLAPAGPVTRYRDVAHLLTERRSTGTRFLDGSVRFIAGLCKVTVIADSTKKMWEIISSYDFTGLSAANAWLGIICYALWIYFAFSGCSDMAVGLGKLFGFDFRENFNYPYNSRSVTEFTRRWHMSLIAWFEDYVGSSSYIGIFITWLLIGLWHGTAAGCVLWGLYLAVILAIEKAFWGRVLKKISVFANLYTLLVIIIGWSLFAIGDLPDTVTYLGAMFGANYGGFDEQDFLYNLSSYAGVLILAVIIASGLPKRLCDKVFTKKYEWIKYIFALLGLLICVAYII